MSLVDVRESKIYVRESNSIQFPSPKSYIDPFLQAVGYSEGDEVTVKTQSEVINENDDGVRNIAYPRVNVEVRTKHDASGLYSSVIGMVYALDIQKPIMKIYTGQNAKACTNLTIFSAESVYNQDLLGNYAVAFDIAKKYFDAKQNEAEEFLKTHRELIETFYDREHLNEEIGRLLRLASKSRIGTTPIVQAIGRIDKRDSIYYVPSDEKCSKMNLYQAITQSFTNSSDIVDKATKTVQLAKALSITN